MRFGSRLFTGVLRDAAGEGGEGGAGHSLEQRISHLQSEIRKERDEREAAAAKSIETTVREALGKFEYARASGLEIAYRNVKDQLQVINGELYGPDYSSLDIYLKAQFAEDLSPLLLSNTGGALEARRSTIDLDDIRPGSPKLETARVEIARLVAQQLAPASSASSSTSKGPGTATGIDLDDIRPGSAKLEAARREIAKLATEMVKADWR